MIKVSVIIPTLNRAAYLRNTLLSILKQSFPSDEYEIIVVDNGSTDNTKKVCEELNEANDNRLIYLYDATPGLHVGRHLGARHARSNILLYGDDDIIAPPEWVTEIYRCYDDPAVGLASGKVLPKYEAEPPDWINLFPSTYLSLIDPGDEYRVVEKSVAFGCNLSVRRDVLYEMDGFHPDAMPSHLLRFRGNGETALTDRFAGSSYKMIYNPRAYVYHVIPAGRLTIDFFKKRAFLEGIEQSYAIIRNSGSINDEAFRGKLAKPGLSAMIFTYYRMLRLYKLRFMRYAKIYNEVREAFREGMRFHRNEVKASPELLEWVLKKDYF